MIEYIYFVKCPNYEDEPFDFFEDAKECALHCLSQKPIITQVEVHRNDFGECEDSCDLGTVWSWEDMMSDTEKEPSDEPSLLTKDFLNSVEPGTDPEFDNSDVRFIDEMPLTEAAVFSLNNKEDLDEFYRLCNEVGLVTVADLNRFIEETKGYDGKNILDKLREYRDELGDDFKITEETHAQYAKPEGDRIRSYENALTYAKKFSKPYIYGYTNYDGKFFALDQPIKVVGPAWEAEKEFRSQYKNCRIVFVAYPNKFSTNESTEVRKPVPEGMTIKQLVETMEENEDMVECTWCNDLFSKDECRYEVNLGYLCSRCEAAIKSRGETLTFRENNYWDFLDEEVEELDESAILAGAASGLIVELVKRIIDKYGSIKKQSKWIDYKKYIIEKTPDGKVNIWDINGREIFSDLKTVDAAKQKIKTLPRSAKAQSDLPAVEEKEPVAERLGRDPFDHHDPDYNEDEAADYIAHQIDQAWDSRYDDALDTSDFFNEDFDEPVSDDIGEEASIFDDVESVEDVVDILVKDEEEAITAYEEATEKIEELASEESIEETKELLDHIKEEEVEHIEELKELLPEEDETSEISVEESLVALIDCPECGAKKSLDQESGVCNNCGFII